MALAVVLVVGLAFAGSVSAQQPPLGVADIEPYISASGSISVVPIDTWGSGDFDAASDSWFGYTTPRTNKVSVSMDQTASTTYEGDLFLRKLRLKVGLDVDVDNNFIGTLDRFMGYINYSGFTLRVQRSELRGTLDWIGGPVTGVPDLPTRQSFDNPYISVDLLHYSPKDASLYYGIGYTSYRLPVQLDCLIYRTDLGEVWWAPTGAVYQPDMAFHIYSGLFGIDTLHGAFERSGMLAAMQGFSLWMATQDRAGVGLSYISDQAKAWVEAANGGLSLWSAEQIAMLVDYDLILGVQWVGDVGPLRLGCGLGFEFGGQVLTCITPKGPVKAGYVDASPSIYLVHYGPVLKGTISW